MYIVIYHYTAHSYMLSVLPWKAARYRGFQATSCWMFLFARHSRECSCTNMLCMRVPMAMVLRIPSTIAVVPNEESESKSSSSSSSDVLYSSSVQWCLSCARRIIYASLSVMVYAWCYVRRLKIILPRSTVSINKEDFRTVVTCA